MIRANRRSLPSDRDCYNRITFDPDEISLNVKAIEDGLSMDVLGVLEPTKYFVQAKGKATQMDYHDYPDAVIPIPEGTKILNLATREGNMKAKKAKEEIELKYEEAKKEIQTLKEENEESKGEIQTLKEEKEESKEEIQRLKQYIQHTLKAKLPNLKARGVKRKFNQITKEKE